MNIIKKTSGLFSTNSYLIESGDDIFLIDAPDRNEEMVKLIEKKGKLTAVLLTHGHFDHVMGVKNVLSFFPETPVYLSRDDHYLIKDPENGNRSFLPLFGIPLSCYTVDENTALFDYPEKTGPFIVMKTPGHTPGSVSLYDEKNGILFSGDTLFCRGEGRTDLGGNSASLRKSLSLLLSLPEKTSVYPGHGEGTVIGEERYLTYRF